MPSVFRNLLRHPNGPEEEVECYADYTAAVQSAFELQLHVIEDVDRRRYLRGQVIRLHNPLDKLTRIQKLLKELDPAQNYPLIMCVEDPNGTMPPPPMLTEAGRPLRRSAAAARAEMTTMEDNDNDNDNDSSVSSDESQQDSSSNSSDSDFQDDDDATTAVGGGSHNYMTSHRDPIETHSKAIWKSSGVRTRRQRSELVDSDAMGVNSDDGHWRIDHWDIKPQREPLLIPFPDDGTHLIGRARWYRRTW